MYGSVAFHGWIESAIYTKLEDERDNTINVSHEFRAFPPSPSVNLKITMAEPGQPGYEVNVDEREVEIVVNKDELIDILRASPNLTEAEIQAASGWGRTKTKNELTKLLNDGIIVKDAGKGKGRGNGATYRLK
jgi:hypothetical protein